MTSPSGQGQELRPSQNGGFYFRGLVLVKALVTFE